MLEKIISPFLQQRMRVVLLLGFASGLPLALSSSTLQAWYAVSNVDITTIGFLSLVGQPYVYKFLWAPLIDRYFPLTIINRFKRLGNRKQWMLLTQLLLSLIIVLMSFLTPAKAPLYLAALALMLAFASATQDIAFDAYRADILLAKERGLGAALSVGGYRVAMLVSGGVILVMADYMGWQLSLLLMSALMLTSALVSYFAPEPELVSKPPISLKQAVVEPFKAFFLQAPWDTNKVVLILIFIIIYKLGDAFAGSLTTTFLLRYLHFSLTEVGLAMKSVGLLATLLGVFLGGLILYHYGLYKALLGFGIFQAVTNLGFVVLTLVEPQYWMMISIIGLENLAGGMGTSAFVALLMGLCHQSYSATQFALLSAFSAIARVYVGPISGYGINYLGWYEFYLMTFFIALPSLFLLMFLKTTVVSLDVKKV